MVFWSIFSKTDVGEVVSRDDSLAWFESGSFEVGIATVPGTPRVGENDLIVKVRLKGGKLAVNAEVSAYAEMPAMGSMAAMRAPADLVNTTSGQFEGAVDLRMRGAWPLMVSIADVVHGSAVMSFDLATDRPGLRISSGGTPIGVTMASQAASATANAGLQVGTINVDSRRRQLIGLETDTVTHHDLVRTLRAIGNVTYDERRLKKISLKYDAWIGELDANYIGAYVTRGQRLFSIYSPELFAAQQEYL